MPAKIGRYRVERRLGSGAFATVWLAEDDALGSFVAVKVLADNWAHHADVRSRFEQEAQVLRRVDSERLVRVHDFGELPDGRPYQVMTYAAGGNLAERLAAGPMPIGTALSTAAEIARAVSVLHDAGVLHRDLKPSNVLFHPVRDSERVLVADLGLAKAIAHASGFTVVAGSPGYMAPEQRLPGDGLDVRADVYAIGAMAYHMLVGRAPTADGSTSPAPSKVRPGVPRQVDRVVQRALDPDRGRRWPSTDALATALDEAAGLRGGRNRLAYRIGLSVGVVVALAAVAGLGGDAGPLGTPAGWVRLFDDTRAVSIAVPRAWAAQARTAGWNPAGAGLPPGREPALTVGADLNTWNDQDSVEPGVFVGRSAALAGGARFPPHDRCTRLPDRGVRVGGLTGRVHRWTACGGTAVSYSEIVLTDARGAGLYVQIKQPGPADRTDQVLRTLRLRPE